MGVKSKMGKQENFSDKVLKFNGELSNFIINLPNNYRINNPFNSRNKEKIMEMTSVFYKKYYNDNNKRYMILGSSPARRGNVSNRYSF